MQNGNAQNVTEPDFWKKFFSGRKCRKYAGKTGFLAFSQNFIISFFWFFAQRCALTMLKTWQSPIFENDFFRPKMPEICRKSPFLQILFGVFLHISLFFHTKTLLIAIPTIKHVSIVKKTYFWSRNCLKIAGTAHFRRKNSISWISKAVLDIFSWNFSHWRKMIMFKMWRSQTFETNIFPAENAGNMSEKLVFWHFLEILSLVFSDFLHKDAH